MDCYGVLITNGVILQWGWGIVQGSHYYLDTNIIFPISFSNGVSYAINISSAFTQAVIARIAGTTRIPTGVTIRLEDKSTVAITSVHFFWIAVGF